MKHIHFLLIPAFCFLALASCSKAPEPAESPKQTEISDPAHTTVIRSADPAPVASEVPKLPHTADQPLERITTGTNEDEADDEPTPSPAEAQKLQQEYYGTQEEDRKSEIVFELSDMDTEASALALAQMINAENNVELKAQMLMAYGDVDAPADQKISVLSRFIAPNTPEELRSNAIEALEGVDDPRAIGLWQQLLNDPDEDLRDTAKTNIERLQAPPEPDDE